LPAGRTPEIAAKLLIEALGSAVSCVTTHRLDVSTNAFAVDDDHTVAFPNPISLRAPAGGPSGLFFDAAHVFAVVEAERVRFRRSWRVTTRMYEYRLLDHHHEELLVYHCQPGPDFEGPDHPHLHVSAALDAQVDAVTRRGIDLDRRETLDRTEAVFRDGATQRA